MLRYICGAAATACLIAGCSTTEPQVPDPSPLPTVAGDAATVPPTSPAATPPAEATPAPPHPVSLPAMFDADLDGGDLEVGDILDRNDSYTRYAITYASGDLTISGIMNVPGGDGPFPVLILAHGYIDPAIYTSGRGLAREQDYLARQGYVVLHTDYRNHAGSDDDPGNEVRLRLGYTEDVINAVLAIRESQLPFLDGDRVGLLGRSMGGGVTYNVLTVAPGLVDAAVVYAPVSSDAADNFDRWTRGNPDAAELAADVISAYGAPEDEPGFWLAVSPRTYVDRITEPILILHGTADDTTPIEWTHETMDALSDAGVDAELIEYEGEPHAFEAAWAESIEQTTDFFDVHLGD